MAASWHRCSSLHRLASITSWSAIPRDRAARTPCHSPISASSSASPRLRQADSRAVSSLALDQPRVALSMDYGYPGSAGYRHERPFDYFRIESSVSGEGLEHLSTRGLIAGADYGSGRVAGFWGLYGTYDYFAPHDFRFSSTSFSFGTTLQAPLSELAGGAEFGACRRRLRRGVFRGPVGRRNDHYGVAPQALANLRLIAGRRAALDLTAREYYISTARRVWYRPA